MASKETDIHQFAMQYTNGAIPLCCAPEGQICKVCTINGGCGLKSRLYAMGINSCSEIEVLKSEGHGPVIVGINDTRLALGQGMARKIIVEAV